MWIANRAFNRRIFPQSVRLMSQLVPDDATQQLHRKRESTNLFDPDLYFEDTLITAEGLIDYKKIFQEFSSDEKLDNEKAEKLVSYNKEIDQEFHRKYLGNRNLKLEDLHYTHTGDNQVADEDQAAFFRFPRTEPYRRIQAGQLYKVPCDDYKRVNIERSKAFVKELFPPYELKDQVLLRIQEELKNPEADREEIINELREIIPKLNYNLMADLALFLALDAQISDIIVWKLIQESMIGKDNEITLYSFHDLCKVHYAISNVGKSVVDHTGVTSAPAKEEEKSDLVQYKKPIPQTHELKKAIRERIEEDIDKASSYDLMLAMQSFRSTSNKFLFDKFADSIVENRERFLNEFSEDDDQGQIHMIINLLYSYASNRTKKPYTHQDLQMKLDKKIFNAYEYDFLDLTQFCDADHLTRLAQTTSLMMSTEELHVLRRIENKTIDELDNLDDYHISQIIRSFTKSKYCSGYGSDETFNKLEEKIITMIDKFDMKSLSHIIETYGYREQGSPHLHKKFLERVSKNEEALDHYTVANLLYYLMYTDNTDEEIWTQMVQHTLNNNDKIPVTVYTPFKIDLLTNL